MSDTMTRDEWTRRYADRIKERAGWDGVSAMDAAEAAAESHLLFRGDGWADPEGDADAEMSYWDDDEAGT